MKVFLKSAIKKLPKLPFSMIFLITLIASFGFALLYSAGGGNFYPWAAKQMAYFIIFMPVMILISITNLRIWYKSAYLFYYIALLLLILVSVLGHKAMGATRWIDLGIIKLQPSELMKIAVIFALARYFHDLHNRSLKLIDLVIPFIILIVPSILIIKQPDLGTAMIILMLGIMILFVAGVKKWLFICGFIFFSTSLPITWQFLHDYQKNRILTFINPERDPLGNGYNIIQSKIAIGSGGFFGKGFIKGSQSQLQFLPERQTDFIFTMVSEEWGFLGASLLLISYSILLLYCYLTAFNAKSHFARLLAIGITSMLFLHIFINIAMVMGLLPVVGVPLPLISYGGTMMITVLISLSLIINIHIHNREAISNNLKSLF